jgi:ribosomal protein S18 acetylase RimI-like enzyme
MTFAKINTEDTKLLEQFILLAGDSLQKFRYFNSRPLDCIQNHICTYILSDNEIPVAYGHLDKEDNTTWLGIAVIANAKGKGYGKQMMQKLITSAKEQNIAIIKLSVDNDNLNAITLYKNFGFKLLEEKNQISFYNLQLN